MKSKDSLDESSDVEELGDDELEPAVTDSEDEAAMIPSPHVHRFGKAFAESG